MKLPAKKKKNALKQTSREFAEASTVHGLSYIFDRSQPHGPRYVT